MATASAMPRERKIRAGSSSPLAKRRSSLPVNYSCRARLATKVAANASEARLRGLM
jgi:hypothetical protein